MAEVPAVAGSRPPLYRLSDEESGALIVTFEDLETFFSAEPAPERGSDLRLIGVVDRPQDPRGKYEFVELEVVARDGATISRYNTNGVRLLGWWGPDHPGDLRLDLRGYRMPFPMARWRWRQWTVAAPTEPGTWAQLPPEAHADWLHVCQSHWFCTGHGAAWEPLRPGEPVTVPGHLVTSEAGLFCALGEAFNAPAGYLGFTLDGLLDCLRSTVGPHLRSTPVFWLHFEVDRKHVDGYTLDTAVEISREYGVDLRLA